MIETDRLILRPLVVEDAEDFYAVCSDPEVLRDTPTSPDRELRIVA